jgi:hypothetical protein
MITGVDRRDGMGHPLSRPSIAPRAGPLSAIAIAPVLLAVLCAAYCTLGGPRHARQAGGDGGRRRGNSSTVTRGGYPWNRGQ